MRVDVLLAYYERIAEAPDAIARLQRFVLDLAVRGKLVLQDNTEEPAALPLKSIPSMEVKLGLQDISHSLNSLVYPFRLPIGWVWTTVGEACSKTGSGSTPRGGKDVYKKAGIPFLRSQNVYDDGLRMEDVAYIDEITHARMISTSVKPGDLLLNITGGSIGRCCRVPDDFTEANVSQHVAILRPAAADMQGFLHTLIRSPYFQSFVAGEQTGAGRGGLPKNRMDRIAVALPPVAEQRRIVAKVDELMALCDRLEAARTTREATRDRLVAASLARLNTPDPETFNSDARVALDVLPVLTTRSDQIKQVRQTILNLAVRGKLVAQEASDCSSTPSSSATEDGDSSSIGRIDMRLPHGWRWVRVGDVASARLGKMLDVAKNKGEPVPYLRNTNVHWFDIRTDDLKTIPMTVQDIDEYRLKAGDVLICEGGHGIGRTAVWKGGEDEIVFQKALHRVRPGRYLDPSFFAQCCFVYFDNGIMQSYFTGVGIPHFTGKALAKLTFPLPPLPEQERIVAKVDELMALCDALEASLKAAAMARAQLLEGILRKALQPMGMQYREAAD